MTVEIREALTYQEGAPRSYFRDLIWSQLYKDPEATQRLEQNAREMAVEYAKRAGRTAATETADGAPIEYRATRTDSNLGTGGEFTVPLWLVDKFATAGRAGRPFADLLQPMALPGGVSSIHIPRISSGTNSQIAYYDGTDVAGVDPLTTDTNSPVVTIAGDVVMSQQLFDMSPIGMDAAFFTDLQRSYNRNLEFALFYANGSTGTFTGVANVSGVPAGNTVAGGALTTVATQWPAIGQAAANLGNNRLLPPEVCLMAPRRWFWVASSVDSSNRPIASPSTNAPSLSQLQNAGGVDPIGRVLGVPVYLDGVIPAGATADDIWFLRPSDMFLWESNAKTLVTANPTSGVLGIRVSYHKYVAFVGSRYPTGIARLSGLPQPSNF